MTTLYLYQEYDAQAESYVTLGLPLCPQELEQELVQIAAANAVDWYLSSDEERHAIWSAVTTRYGIKRDALRARFCPVCGSTGPILCPTFGRLGEPLLLCALDAVRQIVERTFDAATPPGRYAY